MKKSLIILSVIALLFIQTPVLAGTYGTKGKVTAKSIGAGALSLLVWIGIGQAVNGQKPEKTGHMLCLV